MTGRDDGHLAALRARFGGAEPETIADPRFARVAARLLGPGGRRPAPYAGLPTLLSAPARRYDPAAPDLAGLQVGLFGVPTDLGVTNRAGARFGPRALRTIERVGPYHHAHDVLPLHELAVADLGDVPFRGRFRLEEAHEDIEAMAAALVAAGVAPLAAGGDHSISHPLLRAVGRDRPVGLIHVDAHCDTSGATDGVRFHHGGPFRNAVLDGVLDPRRTIQIGIRGAAEWLWEFSHVAGMTVIHAEEIDAIGLPAVIARARAVAGAGPVYLSFDIDALDPAFAPGTGTPEPGGLSMREAQALLRGLKGLDIVAGDVVEVAPPYDAAAVTALAGATLMFEILALMAFAPSVGGRPAGGAR